MSDPPLSPVREWELELLSLSFPKLRFTVERGLLAAYDGWGAQVAEANSAREMLSVLGERVRVALMACYPRGLPVRERTGSPVS